MNEWVISDTKWIECVVLQGAPENHRLQMSLLRPCFNRYTLPCSFQFYLVLYHLTLCLPLTKKHITFLVVQAALGTTAWFFLLIQVRSSFPGQSPWTWFGISHAESEWGRWGNALSGFLGFRPATWITTCRPVRAERCGGGCLWECWVRVPPTEVSVSAGQTGRECKMAHSCRWRFPARPGGSSNSGTGRRAGRIRVTASLRSVSGGHPNAAGLGPGFDAALQVSSVIGSNLQKFRDVLGESSDSSSGEVSTGRDGSGAGGASGGTAAGLGPPGELLLTDQELTVTLWTISPSVGLGANLSLPRIQLTLSWLLWP